jgi:hypothetical protein
LQNFSSHYQDTRNFWPVTFDLHSYQTNGDHLWFHCLQ